MIDMMEEKGNGKATAGGYCTKEIQSRIEMEKKYLWRKNCLLVK